MVRKRFYPAREALFNCGGVWAVYRDALNQRLCTNVNEIRHPICFALR